MNMLVKAAGKYYNGNSGYVKVGGNWKSISNTYVKVNGEWRSELQLATPTITWNSDTDILTISPVDNAIEYEITIEWEYYTHTFYTSNTTLHISEFYQELFSVPSDGLETYDSYYIKVRAVRDSIFSDYSNAVGSRFGEWFNVSYWLDYSGMCSEDNCVSQFETLRAYLDSDSDYIQDHNAVVLLNGIPFVAVYNDTQGIEFYNDHFGMTYYIQPTDDYDQNNEYVYGLVIYDITNGAYDKVNDFMIDWYEPTQENSDTITVTYDGNGGTIDGQSTKTINVNSGTNITLLSPDTRSGYTFDSWLDSIDNLNYQPSDSFQVNEKVTFTAQWIENDGCDHSDVTITTKTASDYSVYDCTTCPTGTKKVCNICGKTLSNSLGPWSSHSWGNQTHVAATDCSSEGYYIKRCTRNNCVGSMQWGDGTTGPHKYGSYQPSGNNTHTRTCSICGGSESSDCSIIFKSYSGENYTNVHTVSGTCEICGGNVSYTESCTPNGPTCMYCGCFVN